MKALLTMALCATSLFAAADAGKLFDSQLTGLEKEFVPLVEAMPANQFDFAPKDGAFKGVRTFGMQSKHVAYVIYQVSAALLGEKNPSAGGEDENGPANLKSKEEITKYVKDAFAYAHKAVATLTNENLLQDATNPFNSKGKSPRLSSATLLISHSFDHYGQMVVYARMNQTIPPASR
jgi:uncharacterized damage-inducible protein DinB